MDNGILWSEFISNDKQRWCDIVGSIFFIESCLDAKPVSQSAVTTFVCYKCSDCPSFLTSKALEQHNRVKHKSIHAMAYFSPLDGVCLVCKSNFHTRLRVFRHMCDRRRPKCRDVVLTGNFTPLSASEIEEAMVQERSSLKHARSLGHRHVLAIVEARTSDGRIIGRVSS